MIDGERGPIRLEDKDKDAILVWMPNIKEKDLLNQRTSQSLREKDLVPGSTLHWTCPKRLLAISRSELNLCSKFFNLSH